VSVPCRRHWCHRGVGPRYGRPRAHPRARATLLRATHVSAWPRHAHLLYASLTRTPAQPRSAKLFLRQQLTFCRRQRRTGIRTLVGLWTCSTAHCMHRVCRWVCLLDPSSGFPYYYCPATGISQWERPDRWDGPGGPAPPPAVQSPEHAGARTHTYVHVNVHVNELRLGFSSTTRNPEVILSCNNICTVAMPRIFCIPGSVWEARSTFIRVLLG
jgi:hypothetical protein